MSITNMRWVDTNKLTVLISYDNSKTGAAGMEISGDLTTIGDGPTRRAVKVWLDLGNTPETADPLPLQKTQPLSTVEFIELIRDKGLISQVEIDTKIASRT